MALAKAKYRLDKKNPNIDLSRKTKWEYSVMRACFQNSCRFVHSKNTDLWLIISKHVLFFRNVLYSQASNALFSTTVSVVCRPGFFFIAIYQNSFLQLSFSVKFGRKNVYLCRYFEQKKTWIVFHDVPFPSSFIDASLN